MKFIWTIHAIDRQKEWEKNLGITRQKVEDLVSDPEQIVPGDMGVLVSQTKIHGGLLRVPFIEIGMDRKIITVYWTSKVERYWRDEA